MNAVSKFLFLSIAVLTAFSFAPVQDVPVYLPPNRWLERDFEQFKVFEPHSDILLFQTGLFHGKDVPEAVSTVAWSGLYYKDGVTSLRPVELKTFPAFDPVLDREGEETALRAEVSGDRERLLALVCGLAPVSFSEFAVKNAAGEAVTFPYVAEPGARLSLGEDYFLQAYGNGWSEYMLEIGHNEGKEYAQYFAGAWEYDDITPTIYWIGDLNGDDRPDILMNISHKYSYSHLALFMSDADDARLLVPVAEFRYTAC